MQHGDSENLALVKRFLAALSEGRQGDDLADFYAPDALQTEYPNTLTRHLTTRGLEALKEASVRGNQVISRQQFTLVQAYEAGNTVIIEAIWTATLRVAVGSLPAGGTMKAWFAQFFEIERGRILRQRNYDCFEPFLQAD